MGSSARFPTRAAARGALAATRARTVARRNALAIGHARAAVPTSSPRRTRASSAGSPSHGEEVAAVVAAVTTATVIVATATVTVIGGIEVGALRWAPLEGCNNQ